MSETNFNVNGFYGVPKGEIAYVEMIDGDTRECYYQPDQNDMRAMCAKYELVFDRFWELVQQARSNGAVVFVVDVPKYKESERERYESVLKTEFGDTMTITLKRVPTPSSKPGVSLRAEMFDKRWAEMRLTKWEAQKLAQDLLTAAYRA